jgi:hypothetical protein
MGLVQDASRVVPVRGQVVSHHTVYLTMATYPKDLLQGVAHSLFDLLVRDDVNVVEDEDGLTELHHFDGACVHGPIELYTIWTNVAQGIVRRQTGEQEDGPALELLPALLHVLSGVGALARIGWSCDVQDIPVLGHVRYVLELVVACCLSCVNSRIRLSGSSFWLLFRN